MALPEICSYGNGTRFPQAETDIERNKKKSTGKRIFFDLCITPNRINGPILRTGSLRENVRSERGDAVRIANKIP